MTEIEPIAPRRVSFHHTKYGREVLVDAAYLSQMPTFDLSSRPYSLSFHDILLITKGAGVLTIDGDANALAPGAVVFTRPGDVRQFTVQAIDGACIFFTAAFITEAFADARFLDQFVYFRTDRPASAMMLTAARRRHFLMRFGAMTREFEGLRADASHFLRAQLYEILVLLNRWYIEAHGDPGPRAPNAVVERFETLIERHYRRQHRAAGYAEKLAVSPGHLNALCQTHRGVSASAMIRARVVLEGQRMLRHSNATAGAIAYKLGFADPAYFSRFFRRETGKAPRAYRHRDQ